MASNSLTRFCLDNIPQPTLQEKWFQLCQPSNFCEIVHSEHHLYKQPHYLWKNCRIIKLRMETNFVNKRAVKISLLNSKTLEHMNSLMCVPSKFIIWSIVSVIMTMPKPAFSSSHFWNADQRTHTELLVLLWKLLVLQNFQKPNHKVVNKIKELPNTRPNPNPKKNSVLAKWQQPNPLFW